MYFNIKVIIMTLFDRLNYCCFQNLKQHQVFFTVIILKFYEAKMLNYDDV